MGNSRSSQALQEENISQIEADTGCKCTYLNTLRQNINFANDLDYLLIYPLLFNYFIKSLLELVSKELNHFGVISGLFRLNWGHSSRFVLFCSF